MEEVESKVEDGTRDGSVINAKTSLVQVPSARSGSRRFACKHISSCTEKDEPDDQHGRILHQLILLASRLEIDLTTNSIAGIDLAIHEVGKPRGVRMWDIKVARAILECQFEIKDGNEVQKEQKVRFW